MRALLSVILLALFGFSAASDVPESHRSKNAVERVKLQLEDDLERLNLSLGASVFIQITKSPAE